jgi:hypothetical protein
MSDILEIIRVEIDYQPKTSTLWMRVQALVDNMVLVHHQTLYDPEEYEPAVCVTELTLDDSHPDVTLNDDEITVILEESGCTWTLYEGDT